MKWFKHDSNSSADAKMRKLILRHGPEGYAVYFHCLELICSDIETDNITFELEHDAEIIAENLKIKSDVNLSAIEKVESIMRTIISLDLFQESNGKIACFKLAKRIDQSMTSNPKMRTIINSINNHDSIMIESGKPMQDKIRLDKNRIDKNKEDVSQALSFFSPEFKMLWERWTRYKRDQFKFRYKSQDSEQTAIDQLTEMAGNNPIIAAEIVNQSIAGGWRGLFALKSNPKTEEKPYIDQAKISGERVRQQLIAEGVLPND